MTDTTQANTPVESPDAATLESLLEQQFSDKPPEPKQTAPEVEAAEEQPDEEGLTPSDLQPEDEEPTQQEALSDVFEIVHNGQQVKLSRAEIIENAQKGFDYERKTQAVAEKARTVDATLQRLQAVEQIMPMVQQDLAVVKSLESQLQQYSKVDWVRLASEDPLEYPKHRAQYDTLVQAYQGAVQTYQHKAHVVQAERQNIHAQRLQGEAQALIQRIPEWADQAKYETGAKEIRAYLIKQGADPAEVDGLTSAVAVDIARKAMLYDRLKSLKADRSKQLRAAPPVVKPGTVAHGDQGKANFAKAVKGIKQYGRQGNHHAQEKLMEGLLGKAFQK